MAKYRVIYTTYVEVEAEDSTQALGLASGFALDDFAFLDAEVEELEEE